MDWIQFNAAIGVGGLMALWILSALCRRIPWRPLTTIGVAMFFLAVASVDIDVLALPDTEAVRVVGFSAGVVLFIVGAVLIIGRPDNATRGLNGEQWGARPKDYDDP